MAFYRPPELSLFQRTLVLIYSLIFSKQLVLYLGAIGLMKFRTGRIAALFVAAGLGVAFFIMPDMAVWNGGRYSAIFFPLLVAGIAAFAAERSRLTDVVLVAITAWSAATDCATDRQALH